MNIEDWSDTLKGLLILVEVIVFLGMYILTYVSWGVYKAYGERKKDFIYFIILSLVLMLVAIGLISTIFKFY